MDSGWSGRVLIKREHLAPPQRLVFIFDLRIVSGSGCVELEYNTSSLGITISTSPCLSGYTTCESLATTAQQLVGFVWRCGGSADRSIVGCIVYCVMVILLEGDNNNFFRNFEDTHTRSNWCYPTTVIVYDKNCGPIKRSNCEWGVGVSKDGGGLLVLPNQIQWLIHSLFVVKAINLLSQHLPPPTNSGRCAKLCLVGNVNVMMPRIYNFKIPDILIDEMGHHCAIIIISCHQWR